MADHVLSILPSKLCAATALCDKLFLTFYNNEEHKGNLFTPPGEKMILCCLLVPVSQEVVGGHPGLR